MLPGLGKRKDPGPCECSTSGLLALQRPAKAPEKPGQGEGGQTPEALDRLPDDGTRGHPQDPEQEGRRRQGPADNLELSRLRAT